MTTLILTFCYVWWLCMAIEINLQYNGGLLPDIILLTQVTTIGERSGFVFTAYYYVITVYYCYNTMFDGGVVLKCFCFCCFSGVPAWRLIM